MLTSGSGLLLRSRASSGGVSGGSGRNGFAVGGTTFTKSPPGPNWHNGASCMTASRPFRERRGP
jgi:hypothetical protein